MNWEEWIFNVIPVLVAVMGGVLWSTRQTTAIKTTLDTLVREMRDVEGQVKTLEKGQAKLHTRVAVIEERST